MINVGISSRTVNVNHPGYEFLDLKKFEQLTSGYKNIMLDTSKAFVSFMPAMTHDLLKATDNLESQDTAKLLHKIKASTLMLANNNLNNTIISLERSVVQIDSPEYGAQVRKLVDDIQVLINEVNALVNNLAA